MKNNDEINKLINQISNNNLKNAFINMHYYMVERKNKIVNQYRDYILSVVVTIKQSEMFKFIDHLMLIMFTDYNEYYKGLN